MKPDDVSQEAWDQAETYKQLWARGPGTIKEAVARAITAAVAAEREACAARVESFIRHRPVFETEDESGIKWQNGGELVMVDPELVASAIRARSTP